MSGEKKEQQDFSFAKVAEPILKYMNNDQKMKLIEDLTEQMKQAGKRPGIWKSSRFKRWSKQIKKQLLK